MAVWDLENNDFVLFIFCLWNIWTKGRSEVRWQMCCTDGPGGGDLRLRVGPSRAWGSCWKQSCRKQDLSQDTWGDAGRGSSSFDEREEKLTDIRVWLSGMTPAAESSDCTAGCKLRRALTHIFVDSMNTLSFLITVWVMAWPSVTYNMKCTQLDWIIQINLR